MKERIIKFLYLNGEISSITINYYYNSDTWIMELSFNGSQNTIVKGIDLFDCLRSLRSKLDPKGIKILCNGARVDAYPSGMLQGSGVPKVYINTMGKTASFENLVDLFDEAPAGKIGTVEEQREYHDKWIESLGL